MSDITVVGNAQLGQLLSGVMDVLVAFGCTLANAGLLERADIADNMRRMIEQQLRQDSGLPSARQFPAEALRKFFAAPVMEGGRGRAGLVPLDGGRHDDPPSRQGG